MTVEALMTETVTVQRPAGFTQSSSGEATQILEDLGETQMYLEPRDIRTTVGEAREIGYVPLGDWLGVGYADFGFDSHDIITWNGSVFDIVSPPRVMPNPRIWTLSHTELDLQLITHPADEVVSVDAIAMPESVGGTGGT